MVWFRSRKLQLSDFDRHFKPSRYFPVSGEPLFAEYGNDQQYLAGLHCSNLSLIVR